MHDFRRDSYYLNENVLRPFIFLCPTFTFLENNFYLQTHLLCWREREPRVFERKLCELVRWVSFGELLEQVTLLTGGRSDEGVEID